jgi:hypothetical protein
MAQTPLTDVERCAHYRQLAVQFRDWAASESNQQARDGLMDMALQYDRLVIELAAKIDQAIRAKRD